MSSQLLTQQLLSEQHPYAMNLSFRIQLSSYLWYSLLFSSNFIKSITLSSNMILFNEVSLYKLNQTVHLLIQMSSHSKKRKNFFHLSEQQKKFLQTLLPKRYAILSTETQSKQKSVEQISNHIPSQQMHLLFTRSNSAEKKQRQQLIQKKKKEQQQKKFQMYAQSKEAQCSKKIERSRCQPKLMKKISEKSNNMKTKKNKKKEENLFRQSQSLKYFGKSGEQESVQHPQQESFPNPRLKQKQEESNKHSGSTETSLHQLSLQQKQFCFKFLNKLKSSKSAWPFKMPVDPIAQGVPNYLQVIKQPMDLKTIQKKLQGNKYLHPAQFHSDINKIFLNSYKFNTRETSYFYLTFQFQDDYHKLLANIQANPQILNKSTKKQSKKQIEEEYHEENSQEKSRRTQKMHQKSKNMYEIKIGESVNPLQVNISTKKKYTLEQRQKIYKKFYSLLSHDVDYLFMMVISQHQEAFQQNEEGVRINFESMGEQCLYKIQQYLKKSQQNYYIQGLFPQYDY